MERARSAAGMSGGEDGRDGAMGAAGEDGPEVGPCRRTSGDGTPRVPPPLAGAVVRAFVHSTEDAERVRGCVRALAGPDAALDESTSRGYHKQPLRVISTDVRGKPELRRILDLLRADPAIREDYRLTWERRLDAEDGAVHFRLAKQPLLDGRIVLEPPDGEGDVVKLELRLQAYPANAMRYREIAEGLLG